MTPEEIKFRKCSEPDCDYKELRGSRLGDFLNGEFVCPTHAKIAAILRHLEQIALNDPLRHDA